MNLLRFGENRIDSLILHRNFSVANEINKILSQVLLSHSLQRWILQAYGINLIEKNE
jgi:hypothetical protein